MSLSASWRSRPETRSRRQKGRRRNQRGLWASVNFAAPAIRATVRAGLSLGIVGRDGAHAEFLRLPVTNLFSGA